VERCLGKRSLAFLFSLGKVQIWANIFKGVDDRISKKLLKNKSEPHLADPGPGFTVNNTKSLVFLPFMV